MAVAHFFPQQARAPHLINFLEGNDMRLREKFIYVDAHRAASNFKS